MAKKRINSFTFEEKQLFLRYLISEITFDYKKNKAKIIGGIPVSNGEIVHALPAESGMKNVMSLPDIFYSTNYLEFELMVKI